MSLKPVVKGQEWPQLEVLLCGYIVVLRLRCVLDALAVYA